MRTTGFHIKKLIVGILRARGPLGYNMLYDLVHKRTPCGRNQFNAYIQELRAESAISHKKSSTHRLGVLLDLGEKASAYVEGLKKEQFHFFADSLLSALLPFAELRETGNVEEQLAQYDLRRLLPFKMKIELISEAKGRRRVTAEASFNKSGSLLGGRINVY
jgi:hypothetical protein